jgi:pimeloyl-ACP methyl ester carboxylesterase
MEDFIDLIWHQTLRMPYNLAKVIDEGSGQTIILLHGIGRTGQVWEHVIEGLRSYNVRIIAFDLLGFGRSPKPDNIDYDIDDHAKAVIASIKKLHSNEPVIIVGHSMGCLIAARVARLEPRLVKRLVLYEMPLYSGLPKKRIYSLRLNIYKRFYDWVINYQPEYSEETSKRAERIARNIVGFEITPKTWRPFIMSLKNTIIGQTTVEDIAEINIPMDVIYGQMDIFVIKGKPTKIFGENKTNIVSHKVAARHVITKRASRLIVSRITEAVNS